MAVRDTVSVGTDDARMLRLSSGGLLEPIDGFDKVAGLEAWFAGSATSTDPSQPNGVEKALRLGSAACAPTFPHHHHENLKFLYRSLQRDSKDGRTVTTGMQVFRRRSLAWPKPFESSAELRFKSRTGRHFESPMVASVFVMGMQFIY
jgi:hypothetical protein